MSSSVVLTDMKVVLLRLLSSQSGSDSLGAYGFWNEQPPPNLPANVKLTSSTSDFVINPYQVVVGDQIMEPGEWVSAYDYHMLPKCEIHVYLYRDPSQGPLTNQSFGVLKPQEYAVIENIRGILTRHSDRPTTDCMFVFYDPNIVDRDMRNQREVVLHKVFRCSGRFVQTYYPVG